jgi:enoyl-CoA hydratase/carnithine racemase
MGDAALLFESRGAVAWLILNRPEAMNAIDLEMIELYEEYPPRIADDDSIRVLVITGNRSAFCAGADLKQVLASGELPPVSPTISIVFATTCFAPCAIIPSP